MAEQAEKSKEKCSRCKGKTRYNAMLQCFNCKQWIHYECTRLPKYTLASLENSQQRYSCEECVDIPEEFWEEDISLDLAAGKRTNEEPNNEEIESKRRYEVIIENLQKELQEKEKICKVKDRDIKLLQERNSELQDEKKKATVKAKQDRKETEHVNEENLRLDQEIEKLESKL